MTDLTMKLLTGLIRVALVPFTDWLVAHNILTSDETLKLVAELASWAVAIGWTAYAWIKAHRREQVALGLRPGSTAQDVTDAMKRTGALVLLAVTLSALTLSACAGTMPRIQPLPSEVAVADQHVAAVVGNLQQLLTMTAAVADTVSQIEDDASKAGAIPPAADAVFDKAALAYADASARASRALVTGGGKTWPELKALVQPVLERGQVLIDTAWNIKAVKSKAAGFLRALRDGLMELVGQVILAGGLGGAR